MSEPNELESFRLAIMLVEGGGTISGWQKTENVGSEQKDVWSSKNYQQVNEKTKALGAYQFLEKYWDWYSTEAGYPDADWRDPKLQDAVARFWFNKNKNDLGSWELAAVAHFAGRSTAFEALKFGIDSVSDKEDITGVDIREYVDKVMQYYNEIMETQIVPGQDFTPFQFQQDPIKINDLTSETTPTTKEAGQLMSAMTNAMADGGRSKFPMELEYNSQVPSQARSFNDALDKTNYNRRIKNLKEKN
tara:strand:+ start:3228 stop:3968 length:741 start_codon:yes stop_codon:yes gene_type:complete